VRLFTLAAFPHDLAHSVADDARQVFDEAVDLPIQQVDLFLDAPDTGLQYGEVVAIPSGLLEDVPRNDFLAVDLGNEPNSWRVTGSAMSVPPDLHDED
jgi:hypothetical protein